MSPVGLPLSIGVSPYSYATIAEARAEGITVAQADDARLQELLDIATAWIERATGTFFSVKNKVYDMDGIGKNTVVLPAPIISISAVQVDPEDGEAYRDALLTDLKIYYGPEFNYEPRITFRKTVDGDVSRFPLGEKNVKVTGEFGFLENGTTPVLIKRACIRMAVRFIEELGDEDGYLASLRAGMLKSESTDGHSYSLGDIDRGRNSEPYTDLLTGDPEIDGILMEYSYEPIVIEAI